ncbi:MAG: hypothetical protein GKR77_04710 [Legionellales bacterium]|nr:hypothetical protein [Legionellales bacterium]
MMKKEITVNVPLILDVLDELRDLEIQKKLWVIGDPHEVTSLQEAIVALYDDSVLDYALEKKDQVFTADIDSKLVTLYKLFSKLDRDRDAADIIYTEEWRIIRELADDLYHLIGNSEVAKNWHPDDLVVQKILK